MARCDSRRRFMLQLLVLAFTSSGFTLIYFTNYISLWDKNTQFGLCFLQDKRCSKLLQLEDDVLRISEAELGQIYEGDKIRLEKHSMHRDVNAPGFLQVNRSALITELLSAKQQIRSLKERITKLESSKSSVTNTGEYLSSIPKDFIVKHELRKNPRQTVNIVTVLVYGQKMDCIEAVIRDVSKSYAGISFIATSSSTLAPVSSLGSNVNYAGEARTLGVALNRMIDLVNTDYFLFLYTSVEIEEKSSPSSIDWLVDALEVTPQVDVIGGSIIHPSKELEIPCHRLRLCNWTLSKSFEYRRSYGDMIICEETDSPFLARTSKFRKMNHFDENLQALTLTDFFLRKRNQMIIGNRPEVMFRLKQGGCAPLHNTGSDYASSLIPFARKHNVFRFKDSYGNFTSACDAQKTVCLNNFLFKEWNIPHWSYAGLFSFPWFTKRLHLALEKADAVLKKHGFTYVLEGGVALGGIKMRNIFPWDAGDVDLYVYTAAADKLHQALAETGYEVKNLGEETLLNVFFHPPGLDGGLVSFTIKPPSETPAEILQTRINGRLYPITRNIFDQLRHLYHGAPVFEHRSYSPPTRTYCKRPGHNACLPDSRETGGGTFREFFCEY